MERIWNRVRGIELMAGDALKANLPKSDLMLAIWGLGYVGHPDYMARKIANALKPGGVALLHFNLYRLNESGNLIGLKNWSAFLDKLIDKKENLSGCEVKGYKVPDDIKKINYTRGEISNEFAEGDYFVMVKKHHSAK